MVHKEGREAERKCFGGKRVWQCIRDLQRERRGRMAVKVVNVDDEDGKPCVTTMEQQARWRIHFSRVLNVQSQFDTAELEKVKKRPLDDNLGITPTRVEIRRALRKMKNEEWQSTWKLRNTT